MFRQEKQIIILFLELIDECCNLAPFRITILAFQQGKIDSPKILDYMLINKFISAYIHICFS